MLKIVDRKKEILKTQQHSFQLFIEGDFPIYVMGINTYANTIIEVCEKKSLNLQGIIDDYTDQLQYRGYPIYKTDDVPEESVIISCVLEGRLITAMKKASESKSKYILSYLHLVLFNEQLFPQPAFCSTNRADILANIDKYEWLDQILADQKSREVLEKLVDFRLNYNLNAMDSFSLKLDEQYFDEEIIKFGEYEAFVDCGGFDGTTTITFINKNPKFSRVYYFEPSFDEFNRSVKKLKDYPRIEFYNSATYKLNTVLRFDDTKGSASSLSAEGAVEVQAVRLDDVINDRVTMIKMDVEGAECDSIEGATRIIKEYKPRLVVCVYHKQEDFWKIAEKILHIRDDYKVYLRHYTEGIFETVMYFV